MTTPFVNAAFRSPQRNYCFMFIREKLVAFKYGRGVDKKNKLISVQTGIADGFPMFQNTLFD
jgi:hypothetical protein